MTISQEEKAIFEGTAFVTLVTLCPDGTPHPIISGKGTVVGDTITFGIYKMELTQANLKTNQNAWIVAATMAGAPKGVRMTGTAEAQGKQLVFTPSKSEALI